MNAHLKKLLVALIVAVCIHTVITGLSGYGNGFSVGSVLLAANGQSGRDDQVAFTIPVREVVVTDRDKDWKKALKKVYKQLSVRRKVALHDTLFYGEAQYLGEVFCNGHPIQSYRDYGLYMTYSAQVNIFPWKGIHFIPVYNAHSYRFDALQQDTIPVSPRYGSEISKKIPNLGYESDNDLFLLFEFISNVLRYGPCFSKKMADYTFSLRQFDGRFYTINFERENASGNLIIDAQESLLHSMKIKAQFDLNLYTLSDTIEASLIFSPQGFVKEAMYIHRWKYPYNSSQSSMHNIQHPRPDADQNPCEIRIWWKTCSTQRITLKEMNTLPIRKELPVMTLRSHPEKKAYYPYNLTGPITHYNAQIFDTLSAPDPDFAVVETRLGQNINLREQYAKSFTPYWRNSSFYQSAIMYHIPPPLYFIGTPPKHPEKNLGDKLYADMLEKYGK